MWWLLPYREFFALMLFILLMVPTAIDTAVHRPTNASKHGGLITENKTVAGGLIFLKIWRHDGMARKPNFLTSMGYHIFIERCLCKILFVEDKTVFKAQLQVSKVNKL